MEFGPEEVGLIGVLGAFILGGALLLGNFYLASRTRYAAEAENIASAQDALIQSLRGDNAALREELNHWRGRALDCEQAQRGGGG